MLSFFSVKQSVLLVRAARNRSGVLPVMAHRCYIPHLLMEIMQKPLSIECNHLLRGLCICVVFSVTPAFSRNAHTTKFMSPRPIYLLKIFLLHQHIKSLVVYSKCTDKVKLGAKPSG